MINRPKLVLARVAVVLFVLIPSMPSARGLYRTDKQSAPTTLSNGPAHCIRSHNVGKVIMAISNSGYFGSNRWSTGGIDCTTGELIPSCEYPKAAGTTYLYVGAFWIGAIVNGDTLVSTAEDTRFGPQEIHPDPAPFGNIEYRSTIDRRVKELGGAVSEQDYIAVCTDTLTQGIDGLINDEIDNRPHRPLGIRITQRSYAWSYDYADDFVIFDCTISNIGNNVLDQMYIGLFIDGDVARELPPPGPYPGATDDDLVGFLDTLTVSYQGCRFLDTVGLYWTADDDGDFVPEHNYLVPVTGVAALSLLRLVYPTPQLSYNWWIDYFGPQTKRKYREYGRVDATPQGDRNRYALLRNEETDYDMVYTRSISPVDEEWAYPDQKYVDDISHGFEDSRYLVSFGPYTLDPGESVPLTFTYVCGADFHRDPDNEKRNLVDNYNPREYYRNVDFSNLAQNARWASWIFDNPGVDTDSDGYAGEFRYCCEDSVIDHVDSSGTPWDTVWNYDKCDKVWYKGDGVPDFRGASPPPAPVVRVTSETGRIIIRWNGLESETTPDIFTRLADFEGYRVYYSLDRRETSYSLLASYDLENYDKYVWNFDKSRWELRDIPFKIEQLRCLYGDSCNDLSFDPAAYPKTRPYYLDGYSDSIFYFVPHDFNDSQFGITTQIRKTYPNQPWPSTLNPDSAQAGELTDDGYFKYFEYELVVDNVLPTVQYYVNVTTSDFGSPAAGVDPLETSKTLGAQAVYASPSAQDVTEQNLQTYVYPNPYRIDGDYLSKGFEGRDAPYNIPERLRRIHFANLPPKCTISIFTLDGDLVRRLDHDKDPSDPAASHDTWDLITRNTQAVVSGIYYWTVEQPGGETQIGKLVIIK